MTVPAPGGLRAAVADALGSAGPLASAHEGYVVRASQLELAEAVATAIEERGQLVAEAGTGTGKTFAYLVPALLSGARVLVSTGTRNLQDQLHERDLPELIRLLGARVDVALLKGRSNYVCWHHLERNLADGRFPRREDIAQLHRIRRFAAMSPSGDRSGFPGVPEDAPAWALATSTRDNCLGQECPELSRCFVMRARQEAQRADVVVVNHHLFCADLALRDEGVADLLPTADAVIFDEAHQLPEIATQFFGTSVSSRALLDFARDMLRAGLAEARDGADWIGLSQQVEQAVRDLRLSAGPPGRVDRDGLRSRPDFLAAITAGAQTLSVCGEALGVAAERGAEIGRCAARADELIARLRAWCAFVEGSSGTDVTHPPDRSAGEGMASEDPVVVWAEVYGAGVSLNTTPLSVASMFRRHLAAHNRAWIFLSATLAVAGDFSHFVSALGLEGARQQAWDSPFDFQSQGLLYVPEGIGDPAGADFPDRVFRAAWPLVEANHGRAFMLCTTLRMVDRLGAMAREAAARSGDGIEVLVQGSASRAELIAQFRAHRAPVLIGSASFWEGVDVPGRQLSLVIIDKLPFAPPDDPVLRARIDAARRSGVDPFTGMQLPSAAMALKQGAGRLIRSERDRGVLMVCDVRLAERGYGRRLLKSLPPFKRTRSQTNAVAFMEAG